jgi:hypothetical protein
VKYLPCTTLADAAASLKRMRPDLSPAIIDEELREQMLSAAAEFPDENPVTLAHGWLWEEYRCGLCESRDANNN